MQPSTSVSCLFWSHSLQTIHHIFMASVRNHPISNHLHPLHHACTLVLISLHCSLLWMGHPRYLNFTFTALAASLSFMQVSFLSSSSLHTTGMSSGPAVVPLFIFHIYEWQDLFFFSSFLKSRFLSLHQVYSLVLSVSVSLCFSSLSFLSSVTASYLVPVTLVAESDRDSRCNVRCLSGPRHVTLECFSCWLFIHAVRFRACGAC